MVTLLTPQCPTSFSFLTNQCQPQVDSSTRPIALFRFAVSKRFQTDFYANYFLVCISSRFIFKQTVRTTFLRFVHCYFKNRPGFLSLTRFFPYRIQTDLPDSRAQI